MPVLLISTPLHPAPPHPGLQYRQDTDATGHYVVLSLRRCSTPPLFSVSLPPLMLYTLFFLLVFAARVRGVPMEYTGALTQEEVTPYSHVLPSQSPPPAVLPQGVPFDSLIEASVSKSCILSQGVVMDASVSDAQTANGNYISNTSDNTEIADFKLPAITTHGRDSGVSTSTESLGREGESLANTLIQLLRRAATAAQVVVCPYPYTQVIHECFYMHKKKLTWPQARRVCQGMSGELAEPRHIYALQTHMADVYERHVLRVEPPAPPRLPALCPAIPYLAPRSPCRLAPPPNVPSRPLCPAMPHSSTFLCHT
ncbi:hypothetical protein E2C01_034487 [Portunus trituberculatus]|uniref:C-type lectin domain-containing protein n=1 Tax=Portunus trituberculatus TaxID=210409 RepID=A0A5B7F764_PORTR|nr:hypothetical protein [Portunus trituberculatus]